MKRDSFSPVPEAAPAPLIAVPRLNRQFLRFLVVGVANTAFSYGVYAGLLYLGFDYRLANLCAFVLGLLVSFRTQGALVFRQTEGRRFPRYVLGWALMFGFNIGVIALLLRTGMNAYWAGAVALVPVTIVSYLLQRYWVFHPAAGR
jgi:putative flippase GtrA